VSSLKQIENFSLRPDVSQMTFGTANLFRYVEKAADKRRALEDLPSNNYGDIEAKNRLHTEAEAATAKVKAIADCLIAFELRGLKDDDYDDERIREADEVELLMKRDADASLNSQTPTIAQLSAHAREQLHGRRPFHWPVEFPEVFEKDGFAAFVGNPPFMGGARISVAFGEAYLGYLKKFFVTRQNTDLCAYFFQRAFPIGAPTLRAGFIATKTIAQSDTREASLDVIVGRGGRIFRATPHILWPGAAAVQVSLVWLEKTASHIECALNDRPAVSITPFLTEEERHEAPHVLRGPFGCYKGVYVSGTDQFSLTADEVREYLQQDQRNVEVVKPFLVGADLTTSPDCSPSRNIIDFADMSEEEARTYDLPYQHARTRVRPYRMTVNRKAHRDRWWQYGDVRQGLRAAIRPLSRVLVSAQTTKYLCFVWCPTTWVFDQKCVVVATDHNEVCALLSSELFDSWTRKYCATLGETLSFTPSDSFRTFPFPERLSQLASLGSRHHELRRAIMAERREGLTKIYNRFHDRGEQSADIARLRASHVEMDQAVAAAYDWSDLDLGHGFHETKQGVRFTISEPARRDVLDRLLQLNHERYAEEVRLGLHNKKGIKKKSTSQRPKSKAGGGLFT
jgi:hypothetical protein